MPSIDQSFLESLQDDYKNYTCFVETGTYNGETIFAIENLFDTLYTIEISELFFYKAKHKNHNKNKINFLLGDSSDVFIDLLPKIKQKTIFFLDGHYSSDNTGRGKKDCPLIEEIQLINDLFENEAIIIVDDYRLFGYKGNEDWSEIKKETLTQILQSRITKIYHLDSTYAKDDRLIFHIKGSY